MRITILLVAMIITFLGAQAQEDSTSTYQTEEGIYEETDGDSFQETEEGSYSDQDEESSHQLIAPDELKSTRAYQTEKVVVRKFDNQKWKAIVGATDYNETEREKPKPNEMPTISAPWSGPVLRMIAYILIIGVVILLLYYVVKNTSFDIKVKKPQLQPDDLGGHVENIDEIDIHSLIRQAKAEGNFKLAIRLYYLGLLKNLNAIGMIAWKKDKTNRDYLSELFSHDFYFEEMKRLTLSYEQVWYGERLITAESFQQLTDHFETVYQKINTPKEP